MIGWLLLASALARPDAVGSADAPEAPVRCHWARDSDAVHCLQLLDGLEAAWALQSAVGFPGPLPDADRGGSDSFDVYVDFRDEGEGYDVLCDEPGCPDATPGDGVAGASAYAVVDPRTEDPWHQELYAYASTFGLDPGQPLAIRRATGSLLAMLVGGGRAVGGPVDYQSMPWFSALLQSREDVHAASGRWTDYDAGVVALLNHLLAPDAGPPSAEALRDAWLAIASEAEAKPDLLDVLSQSWREEMLTVAAGRASGRLPAGWWTDVPFAWREGSVSDYPHALAPVWAPYPLGASYWDLAAEPGESLRIAVHSDAEVNWGLVVTDPEGVGWQSLNEPLEILVPAPGWVTIGVVNLGPPGLRATDPLEPAPFVLTIRPSLSDDTDTSEPTALRGCSGGRSSGGALLPLALALLYRRQPRRCCSSRP